MVLQTIVLFVVLFLCKTNAQEETPAPTAEYDLSICESSLSVGNYATIWASPDRNVMYGWGTNTLKELSSASDPSASFIEPFKINHSTISSPMHPREALSFACVLDGLTHKIHCVGSNSGYLISKEITSNTYTVFTEFTELPDFTNEYSSFAVSRDSLCAVTINQTVVTCSGTNTYYQNGRGTTSNGRDVPPFDTLSYETNLEEGVTIKKLVSDKIDNHFCALLSNNTVTCWGSNANYALGITGSTSLPSPTWVDTEEQGNIKDITLDEQNIGLITLDGRFLFAGQNKEGMYSNDVDSGSYIQSGPVEVFDSGNDNIACIFMYRNFCLRKTNGTVFCKGENANGQFHSSKVNSFSNFIESDRITAETIVSVNSQVICGHNLTDDTVSCWGANNYPKFDASGTVPSTPVLMEGVSCAPLPPTMAPTLYPTMSPTVYPTREPTTPFPTTSEMNCGANIATTTAGASYYISKERNAVFAWGIDRYEVGVLGLGRDVGDIDYHPPTKIPGSYVNPVQLSVERTSGALACVLDGYDDSVHCIGSDASGVITGTSNTYLYEMFRFTVLDNDETIENINEISVGISNMCLVINNRTEVKCLGYGSYGMNGAGTTGASYSPKYAINRDSSAGAKIIQLENNYYTYCALFDNNTLSCWGYNDNNRMGLPDYVSGNSQLSPILIPDMSFTKVTFGQHNIWGLGTDGKIYASGKNTFQVITSELATNVFTSEWLVVEGTDNYNIDLWAFEQGFCVKKRDRKTYCKGNGAYGFFSESDSTHHFTDLIENTRMPNLREFRSSNNLYVALFEDGTVKTWGFNNPLRIGSSSMGTTVKTQQVIEEAYCSPKFAPSMAPTQIPTEAPTPGHSCSTEGQFNYFMGAIVNTDLNQVWMFGTDYYGKYLTGNGQKSGTIELYDLISSLDYGPRAVSKLSLGNNHACLIDPTDDSVWCWGTGTYGSLGNKNSGSSSILAYPTKVNIESPGQGYKDVVVTDSATFFLSNDNRTVKVMGKNNDNIFGTGGSDAIQSMFTVQDLGDRVIKRIFPAGPNAVCYMYEDNQVACAGRTYGFCHEVQVSKSVVTNCTGKFAKISDFSSPSNFNSCVVNMEGQIVCAGNTNTYGQIDPSAVGTADYTGKVIEGMGNDNKLVVLTNDFTCGVKQNSGDVYCWGRNNNGVLDGDSTNSNAIYTTPIKIQNITGVTAIWGRKALFARTKDGELKTFGDHTSNYFKSLTGVYAAMFNPPKTIDALHDYSCPLEGPDVFCTSGDHDTCKEAAATYFTSKVFCNEEYLMCTNVPECSKHLDCKAKIQSGRLPYCNFNTMLCEDKYEGTCSKESECETKIERQQTFAKSLGQVSQSLKSSNATKIKTATQTIVNELVKSQTNETLKTGANLTVFIDGSESVTLDADLIYSLGGDEELLGAALKELVCNIYSDMCEFQFDDETRRILQTIRESPDGHRDLQSSGSIEVSVTYSLDASTFSELVNSGFSFSDGSEFEEALAAQLNLTTDDITIYATNGNIEIVYVVSSESNTEDDPKIDEKLSAIQSIGSKLTSITTLVATELGVDDDELGTGTVDYCENRDCNNRGTCDQTTGKCTCDSSEYWGVNCESTVTCLNGGVKSNSTAYCICEYPYYGTQCGKTLDCSC